MPQIKVPRKIVCTSQFWISAALVILALVFCLTPIISLVPSGNNEILDDFLDELGVDVDIDEDEYGISMPKLIGSIGLIVNMIQAAGGDDDAQDKLDDVLDTDEGEEQIATIAALVATIMNTFNFEEMEGSNFIEIIFGLVISLIALLYVIVMVFVLPIMVIVIAITTIIKVLKNIKTPENVSGELAGKLTPILSLTLTTKLFMGAIQGDLMVAGSGLNALFILALIAVGFNFVATRLREYPSKQFKYLNIVQPVAIVSIVGFIIFFNNLCNSGILNGFFGGDIMGLIVDAIEDEDIGTVIAPLVMMVIYIGLAIGSMGYLDKAARRLCCSVKPEGPKGLVGLFIKGNISDNNIVHACTNLFVYILPVIAYSMVEEEVEDATGILVGAIIMVVAEIAAIVLRSIFCKDMTEAERQEVLTGTALTSEEKLEEAQKIVAAAQATVNASAPVEAPVAESVENADNGENL
ncbi:MAG: hypothetical protein J6B45_00810 [Clostridia bacterium]|nr:hypothetical protein [Clostridia bacterium]